MRAYTQDEEENLCARKLLQEWRDEGLLSHQQYEQIEAETATELERTNVFLRFVLLLFTLIAVAMAVALFFALTDIRSAGSSQGLCFLVFAVISYSAAECLATQAHLYRHGVEEAFAVAAVAMLCIGMALTFFPETNSNSEHRMLLLAAATGALASLGVWHRFGLAYAFAAAMIFAAVAPAQLTASHAAQRLLLCLIYAAGLAGVAALGSRHRFDYLRQRYSLAEACLWLGIYLTLNLKLSGISTPAQLWSSNLADTHFDAPFYWTTWVLLWCLPPLILTRALRAKDRFVLAVGMLTAVLTLVTNKPYLGLQRHTWDPMLLGLALIAVAVFLLRWLACGPGGVRHGFTAADMSAKDKHTLGVASSVLGFVSPHSLAPSAQPQTRDTQFDSGFGGGSGGAGTSGDF